MRQRFDGARVGGWVSALVRGGLGAIFAVVSVSCLSSSMLFSSVLLRSLCAVHGIRRGSAVFRMETRAAPGVALSASAFAPRRSACMFRSALPHHCQVLCQDQRLSILPSRPLASHVKSPLRVPPHVHGTSMYTPHTRHIVHLPHNETVPQAAHEPHTSVPPRPWSLSSLPLPFPPPMPSTRA